MVEKKFSIAEKIFLIILLCGLLAIFGCASKQTNKEDSNHYRAQTYTCPFCGEKIDIKNVDKNIRMGNTCPACGKIFFYTPQTKEPIGSGQNPTYQYGKYGPRTYGPTSSYQSDVSYQRFGVGGYSFKETKLGFSEVSWYFRDSRVKSHRIVPHWRTTRYNIR